MNTRTVATTFLTMGMYVFLGAGCTSATLPTTTQTTTTITTSTTSTATPNLSTGLPTKLTQDEVLSSGGFENGRRVTSGTPQNLPIEEMASSSIVFGDLDGDTLPEAIVLVLWCGASCGDEIYIFKKDAHGITSHLLSETYKNHPSKDRIKKITLNNRLLTVVRTRGSGTKDIVDTYAIRFSEGVMIVTDGKTGEPVNTTGYHDTNFGFSFAYPEYYEKIPDCQLRTSTVPNTDWVGTIGDGIELSLQTVSPTKKLTELVAPHLEGLALQTKKTIYINGVQGISVEYLVGGVHRYGKNVFWKKDGHLFTLAVVAQGTRCEQGMPQVLHVADSILNSFSWQK